MRKAFLVGLIAAIAASCARGPTVTSDLPLRRVVIYRNGVGYFERAGQVSDERVTFKMRAEAVGDFLASLAIVEKGGSSVRSASFPLELEEPEKVPPPSADGGLAPVPPLPEHPDKKEPKKKRGLRDVVLHLDGEEHDLTIGYVAETPVWRPSYRLVIGKQGKASLQTWGIVQNLSGEDWNGVELVLVAGAPIAFQSTLGDPVVPARPIITDSGEVIAAVPGGVTSLAEEPPPPPMTPQAEASAEEAQGEGHGYAFDDSDDGGAPEVAMGKGTPRASARKMKSANAMPPGAPGAGPAVGRASSYGGAQAPALAPQPESVSAPRNLSALAAVALEGGTTRYEIPTAVTVPDESATMVLLLNEQIPGEAVFLFSPDPGVPDSGAHPFRVARFKNATRGMLERGPIAVFEKGSFLGEGMLDPLPPRATATVPFALERGLAVQSMQKVDQLGARLAKIEASELFIQRDTVYKTTYTARNGTGDAARLLVKHPRIHGARLHQPPAGTEDNVGTGTALVPVSVPARGKAELLVDERSDFLQQADWLSPLADTAVKEYLAEPGRDAAVAAKLTAAWEIRTKLVSARDELARLTHEQAELERATHESRLSLKAIEKNPGAADLRKKLTARLDEISRRMDEITKRVVELRMLEDEQGVRFRDAIRDMRWVRPGKGAAG